MTNPGWYLLLWGGGLIAWGIYFWHLRKRGGPVLFVERQIAHVWGAAVVATIGVFVLELLGGTAPDFNGTVQQAQRRVVAQHAPVGDGADPGRGRHGAAGDDGGSRRLRQLVDRQVLVHM